MRGFPTLYSDSLQHFDDKISPVSEHAELLNELRRRKRITSFL